MTDDNTARYNVQMPKQLRDDAKRNSERGELAEEVRELFRQKAYGVGAGDQPTELEQKQAELREVRERIDDLRHERAKIDSEIEAQEARATRLEERITSLESENAELETKIDVLENMLDDGERLWPTRIKNIADVDEATAQQLYDQLKARNAELPDAAFMEPGVHVPADWREVR